MKQFEFDFANSLGDTIMEKYESLYVALMQVNKEFPIQFVIGGFETISIFEVATCGFDATPIIAQIGDLMYVGKLSSKYLKFHLYKSTRAAKDELLLCGENGNSVLKFTNFII